jgi:hypothetical protein
MTNAQPTLTTTPTAFSSGQWCFFLFFFSYNHRSVDQLFTMVRADGQSLRCERSFLRPTRRDTHAFHTSPYRLCTLGVFSRWSFRL